MARSESSGLSIGYRVGYRIRLFALTVFGPAQLGEANDPKARLERERAARIARARSDGSSGTD